MDEPALPPCLLTYRFATAPAPLAIALGRTPATGVITAEALAGDDSVYCSEILVFVRIGPDPVDLSETTPDASVSTGRWAITDTRIVHGDDLGLLTGDYAQFTFDARDPADYLIDYSLVLGLTAAVNHAAGTFEYLVRETSGASRDAMIERQTSFSLEKRPPQFFLQNLVATAPEAPTVPRTAFANGAPVRLSWESNGTWFQLYLPSQTTPLYAGAATAYTLPAGLTSDTTFVLAGAMTGNSSGDTPSGGYRTLFLYEALTLGVSGADLAPRSVTATGALAGATVTAASVAAGSVATGTVTASARTTSQDLTVTGTADLHDLSTTGTTTLADATVSTHLVGATADMSLMAQPMFLPNRNAWYQAPTDGFVVGWASNQGHDLACAISASTGEVRAAATAAWFIMANPMRPVYGDASFVLPVRKGDRFVVNGPNDRDVRFVWQGLGAGVPVQVGLAAEPEAGTAEAPESAVVAFAQLIEQADGDGAARLRAALARLLEES
ncbi:MAG TPA: hypothetical protein VIT65_24565 [Microlunatus sp.]